MNEMLERTTTEQMEMPHVMARILANCVVL